MPLLMLLPDLPNCLAIRTFSSPRLCFSNVASLWASASALSNFCLSRFWTFCLSRFWTFCLSRFWTFCCWHLVTGSEAFEACDDGSGGVCPAVLPARPFKFGRVSSKNSQPDD
jgi:hypothetical protein